MKPECLECEATLALALERVKMLEEAVGRELERISGMTCPECANDMDASGDAKAAEDECECCDYGRKLRDEWTALTTNALRPEGT